jgi:hypothetical protein
MRRESRLRRDLGRGSVCVSGRCVPYQDETDLFIAVGLSEKTPGAPEPFKPLLSILPAFAYNPTVGFGLRIMMNRQSCTNITLDFTIADKTTGIYFGAGEVF